MVKRFFKLIPPLVLWGICLISLVGCGAASEQNSEDENNVSADIDGRIMLWHSWPEGEADALQAQIDSFERLHPDVRVVVAALSQDEILDRYKNTAALGLGPDLLLGNSRWLSTLVETETIRPVVDSDLDLGRFYPAAVQLVTLEEKRWGVPITLSAPALFYNTGLVETPPVTFEELLQQAEDGRAVGLHTGATSAYLGIQAFGDPLISEEGDELRLKVNGLIAWVSWLKEAQTNPNVILSKDEETLSRLFDRGDIAYTIGGFEDRGRYEEALTQKDEKELGIAPLPAGPIGPARPLIEADVLYFNRASSDRQFRLAQQLARFLSNSEQNSTLMRDVGRVPANQRVRVNSRAYPEVAPFVQSGRTAVVIPLALETLITQTLDDSVYTAVLTGVEEPEAAVCAWQEAFVAESPILLIKDSRCSEDN